jgi:hypothetical protein
MTLFVTAFAISCFVANLAEAQMNICRADTDVAFAVKATVPVQIKNHLPEFQREFQKTIEALNDGLPSSVVTPANLKLSIVDSDGFSELRWLTDATVEVRLALPKNFEGFSQKDFTRMTLAMALHEYGHAIIESTFNKRSETFRKNVAIARNRDGVSKEELNIALVDTLFEKAYEELFADMLAVLMMNNVDAVPQVLEASGGSTEDALIRSFIAPHALVGWDYRGPYGLLSPARNFLGPKIVASRTPAEKSRLVVSVLNAILPSIDQERGWLLNRLRPPMLYEDLEVNPELVNRRFIQLLQQHLK